MAFFPSSAKILRAGVCLALPILLNAMPPAPSLRVGDLEVFPAILQETLPQGYIRGRPITLRNYSANSMPIYIRTSVQPPGQSVSPGLSVYFLNTFLSDNSQSNFTDLLYIMREVETVVVRSGRTRTPTLEELLAHDMVIVASTFDWADPDSLGNVLAAYADAGRPVILMYAVSTSRAAGLRGRIMEPGYSPVPHGNPSFERLTTHFVTHPLTQSVEWFGSDATLAITETQGQGIPLGWYGVSSQRTIAAAYNPEKPVYFVNVLPWEPDYIGHNSLGQLFSNIFDATQGTYNWLHNPVANGSEVFELAPGETRTFILPMGHDHRLPKGVHHGEVSIFGTYPSFLTLPATLHVTPR